MDERAQDRMWDHRQHLNDDFNNISNYFLVAESLLLGLTSAGISDTTPTLLKGGLAALGVFLTLVWAYVQGKQRYLLRAAKRECETLFPEYKALRDSRKATPWRLSNTFIMAYVMPALFCITWVVFAASHLW